MRGCDCYPHGPNEPCTCDGSPGCCAGHVVGCTCDVNWSCTSYDPCAARAAAEMADERKWWKR